MEMNLDKILISRSDQAVALKMISDVIGDLILIEILVSLINQKLRIIAICELIVFCINSLNCHLFVLHNKHQPIEICLRQIAVHL